MSVTRAALSDGDIRALIRGPTEDERAAVAQRLCRRIDEGLDPADREAAEEVMRLMAADAAEMVRRALAVTLKNSPNLPRDVALRLSADLDSIAAPILAFSPVFTDEDLAEVVRAASALKQLAIARREVLSETVADALAEYGAEEAVRTAVSNDNAQFSEKGLGRVLDRFGESQGVANALAYRQVLPLAISERLVDLVTDHVRQHLVDHHALSPETAMGIVLGARERATLDLVEQAGRAADLRTFTSYLHRQDKLTPSLLMRALAHGHMTFFEWAMAQRSGVPHHRVWLMIHDAGPLGLRAIYERAALPAKLFSAFRAAVDTFHALQSEGAGLDIVKFQERMLQRFLTQPHAGPRDDADYLLDKMDRLFARTAGSNEARVTA